jgi:hypothetical protein
MHIYRFLTDFALKDDSPVNVSINNQSIDGQVVSARANTSYHHKAKLTREKIMLGFMSLDHLKMMQLANVAS